MQPVPIRWTMMAFLCLLIIALPANQCSLLAQETGGNTSLTDDPDDAPEPLPEKVTVTSEETVDDSDIAERLTNIADATGWFEQIKVDVEDGVVFLWGTSDSEAHREWLTQLTRRTEDVVAVVNRMEVTQQPLWNLEPAWAELREMLRNAISGLPFLLVAVIMLLLTKYAMELAYSISLPRYDRYFESRLLSLVAARVTAGLILVIGIYLVLRVSGLTRLATTIVGGTGLIGIVFGFAFRDIAENFLASILISLQRPFRIDDLIQVDGVTGFVRRVTTRGTLLQTFDGNHVHISNSTIYKNRLTNYSSNPSTRDKLTIGIGYDAPISEAQEIIYAELKRHPAVLEEPASLVLVDSLGASTVNLDIYLWVDSSKHSLLKVRSSMLRHIVAALTDAGVSMPDEAREVIFPNGMDIRIDRSQSQSVRTPDSAEAKTDALQPPAKKESKLEEEDQDANQAEGDLTEEKTELDKQNAQADQAVSGTPIVLAE